MKKIYLSLITLLGAAAANELQAQTPFNTIEYIDANNVRAATLVHGDMWWDPATGKPACEFPKAAGTNVSTAAGMWMSGTDAQSQLHIAAQTYRVAGNDYWPGPLDSSTAISYTTSQAWARIWKVNSAEISAFIADTPHVLANIPASILEWPAKGNPYAKGANNTSLTITRDMAPFFDANNNGSYNPLDGDFPLIKGNQMLFWVFNDDGPTHNNTNGSPLHVEIKALAYAYLKPSHPLNNIVYYEYNITNRSAKNYTGYRFGLHADVDLGNFSDDFIGYDSAHRMGIVYNGKPTDGSGQPGEYGNNIPMAGVTMIQLPGDTLTTYVPGGSFMYYNNDNSGLGNPSTAAEYDRYMRSRFRDNTHLINDYIAPGIVTTGHGTGNNANYVFPGNPNSSGLWSECTSGNPPGDRRFVTASGDMNFNAGSTKKAGMALVITTPGNTGCPNASFSSMNIAADTAWWYYYHPLATVTYPQGGGGNGIANVPAQKTLSIYPNPASSLLYINIAQGREESVTLYDGTGRMIHPSFTRKNNTLEVTISNLPNGIYTVWYRNGETSSSNVFVKQ